MLDNKDPLISWLEKWKSRMEHIVFFLLQWRHLLLILIIALSLLYGHVYKLKDDLPTIPVFYTALEKPVH